VDGLALFLRIVVEKTHGVEFETGVFQDSRTAFSPAAPAPTMSSLLSCGPFLASRQKEAILLLNSNRTPIRTPPINSRVNTQSMMKAAREYPRK